MELKISGNINCHYTVVRISYIQKTLPSGPIEKLQLSDQ